MLPHSTLSIPLIRRSILIRCVYLKRNLLHLNQGVPRAVISRPQAMFWTQGCWLMDLGPDWACFGPFHLVGIEPPTLYYYSSFIITAHVEFWKMEFMS